MTEAEKFLESVASVPAKALDSTIDKSITFRHAISQQRYVKKANEYWRVLGPGLTTGASDDDPSGIATYSQTGAQYGFQLLWLAGFTFPFMAIIQEMCARIGLVTGEGLAANIKHHYPRWILYFCTILLSVANTFNIGADLGAMAKATQLLLPNFSFSLLVIFFTVLSLGLQIFSTYKAYSQYLKYLALILVTYIFSTFSISHLPWKDIFTHAIIPTITFSKNQIFLICGILGTTISPYLFFWQTSQEVEEEILKGKVTIQERQEQTSQKEVTEMRFDVWIGMFLSNLVMFFIITTCSATLFSHGLTNITTAEEAARALRPFAGNFAYLLFTLGIIGTGLLSVPVLAGSVSYAASESLNWTHGLHRKLKQALAFYGVIIIATTIGLAINFIGLDPIKVLIYSAVANGLVAPFILVMIVLISSNKGIMGDWVNRKIITWLGWLITFLMGIVGIATIGSLFL